METSGTRSSFVETFGEDEAVKIESAATEHMNGVHDRKGSDPFRWAIAICIGYECMELDGYREYHGITAPWEDLKTWIKEHGNLREHDGDVDYMSLFTGVYNEYVEKVN